MNKKSIYFQLIALLLFAAIISVGVFLVQHELYAKLIDNYIYNQDYEQKMDNRYINALQRYIDENDVYLEECEKVDKWVKSQRVVSVSIYHNNILLYNSDYPSQNFEDVVEIPEYSWEMYYDISFADGSARVLLTRWYEYQLYNYALIIEMAVSFLLFITIVMCGIKKKINYIHLLDREIKELEKGELMYPITVNGEDELAELAAELNRMRLSIVKMMEREAEIVRENQRTITEMSHDLRTPVTSILLFLEILKKEQYEDREHIREYLEKVEQKTVRMKQMTEQLLKYSLITKPETFEYELLSVKEIFYDQMSELCIYLEQNDFQIDLKVEWCDSKIHINMEFALRIIDNIASNIIKYADKSSPVEIHSYIENNLAGFSFRNRITQEEWSQDSNGVGLQSINKMMRIMGGSCRSCCEDQMFQIIILFPVVQCNQDPSDV